MIAENRLSRYLKLAVVLGIGIVLPSIFRSDYIRHILVLTFIFSIFALSYDLIIGEMGQISLGQQAFFGIGAYVSALLSTKLGIPVWLCLPAAVVGAGLIALFIGYISLRIRGAYLAIVTLGFAMILWMIATGWRGLTNGQSGIGEIPPPAISIPFLPKIILDSPLSYYYLSLAFLMFTVYFVSRLMKSRLGRAITAIRENEERAVLLGINAFAYLLMGFILAGMLAGFAGFAYAHYIAFVDPKVLSIYYMVIGLIMVIVGGPGTIVGPVLGAFIFFFVPEWLRVAAETRLVFFGVALLIFIIMMPQGVFPKLSSLLNRWMGKRILDSAGTSSDSGIRTLDVMKEDDDPRS